MGINFILDLLEEVDDQEYNLQVVHNFSSSPRYKDITYVLQHFHVPVDMDKTKTRFIKLKDVKYCIFNGCLYWKYPGGIFLNCLLEEEEKQIVKDIHECDCGGHHYWKATVNKIL